MFSHFLIFTNKIFCDIFICSMLATCLTHIAALDLILLITFGDKQNLQLHIMVSGCCNYRMHPRPAILLTCVETHLSVVTLSKLYSFSLYAVRFLAFRKSNIHTTTSQRSSKVTVTFLLYYSESASKQT